MLVGGLPIATAFVPSSGLVAVQHSAVQTKMQLASVPPDPPAKTFDPVKFTKSLPGVSSPLGYFDPLGFCSGQVSESKGEAHALHSHSLASATDVVNGMSS